MIWTRTLHRWIGLILGVQLLLWMLSGLVMGLLPHDRVQGHHYRSQEIAPLPLPPAADWSDPDPSVLVPPGGEEVRSVSLRMFDQIPVYRVVRDSGVVLIDARSAQVLPITMEVARRIAARDYSGPGKIKSISRLEQSSLAMRAHRAPAWKVDFDDPESTSLYISAGDGEILERRNSYWRIFDVFWMLHIMDYKERVNFNNGLIIVVALILLWMGVTGVMLWADSFHTEDFALIARWRARSHRYTMEILDSEGGPHKSLSARPRQTLFASMAAEDLALPSSCGGGGTCGLCRVRITPSLKISAADRRRIPQSELDQGFRLACQHRIGSDVTITLPHGLLDAGRFQGLVASRRFVTPFICEIRIRLMGEKAMSFRAGSYIQLKIPPFRSSLEELVVPKQVRSFWLASKAPTGFGTENELYRTYSISSAPGELDGDIALNVRMAMPRPDTLGVPIGVGSAYVASLKVDSLVEFRGPLGDFRVHETTPELVFIGGGAGMGPLRSMIVDQLVNKRTSRRISFWYGARTEIDLYYSELFTQLEGEYPNFSWRTAFSEVGTGGSRNDRGYIHEVVREQFLAKHPDLSRCSFHICGPPPMLEAVLQLLGEYKVTPEKIAFDDFGI